MSTGSESNSKEREKFENFMMSNTRGLPPLLENIYAKLLKELRENPL